MLVAVLRLMRIGVDCYPLADPNEVYEGIIRNVNQQFRIGFISGKVFELQAIDATKNIFATFVVDDSIIRDPLNPPNWLQAFELETLAVWARHN